MRELMIGKFFNHDELGVVKIMTDKINAAGREFVLVCDEHEEAFLIYTDEIGELYDTRKQAME